MVQGVDSGILHADSQTDGVQLCPSLRISLSPENCLVQGSRTVWFGSVSQCLGPRLGRLEDQELVCGWDLGTSGGSCSHVWELMLVVGCGLIRTVGQNTYAVASSYIILVWTSQHGRWVSRATSPGENEAEVLGILWSSFRSHIPSIWLYSSGQGITKERPHQLMEIMPICHFKKTREDVRY